MHDRSRRGGSRRGGSGWAESAAAFVATVLTLAACDSSTPTPETCALSARPLTTAVGFDANSDGVLDVADGTFLLARNFRRGAEPPCLPAVEAFGDKVSDVASAYAMWYALIGTTAVPVLGAGDCSSPTDVPAPCGDGLALSIDAPASATGPVGETVSFTGTVQLTAGNLSAEAWSISVTASGCTLVGATLAGTQSADVRDSPPGSRTGGLGMAALGATGAVSLVVLDPIGGTGLQIDDSLPVLSLTVDAPVGSSCATCTLTFADGLTAAGRPLTNTVAATGRSYAPTFAGASVEVCPGGGG